MNYYFTTLEKINQLVSALLKENWNVIANGSSSLEYSQIENIDALRLNGGLKPVQISMKEYFFPKSETLFFYKKDRDGVEIYDPLEINKKTLFLGVKPCDAAGVPVLSKVFNWDYKDEFFNRRVENSIIIGMECSYRDDSCFCTSVGLSPVSEKGSDLFLYQDKDGYVIKSITPKGEDFLNSYPFLKEKEAAGFTPQEKDAPAKKFEYGSVKEWLDNNFNNDFWNEAGELCLGCGQCAYSCPVCHCFDIVDEECGFDCGRRVKNWDTCQSGLFTKHASGHNPRNSQDKRYRQRVSHKFKYYNDKFGEILCTGCGRCTRGCPAGIDISEIVSRINEMA